MSAKAYLLEDRIKGKSYYLPKFSTFTVGRNLRCSIPTLNPKTLNSRYTNNQKRIAGCVSGIHFYIRYSSDGNVYVWDNGSTNGLYIQSSENEQILRVHKKTAITPGTTIFASTSYTFLLRKKIDADAQQSAEEKASTETTQILKSENLIE
jgi:pSer/pThr/pTyr-binding forkhead associated (FHA) protein